VNRVQSSEFSSENSALRRIFAELCRLNSELFLVGGPVRDRLLARRCHDWDLACRNAQSTARQTAKVLHGKFITLDEQHRIFRVILPDHTTLDFAELQGKTIEQDLSRRDFTINAMAIRLCSGAPVLPCSGLERAAFNRSTEAQEHGSTVIVDPFGGQRDLRRKIIRAVSPRALVDDPLRLLRAFRFAAQFQFAIEARTLRWIRKHRESLWKVAAERIREEWLRLLMQPAAAATLKSMDQAGLLPVLFPDLETCRRVAVRYYGRGGVLKHSLQTVGNLEWIFERMASEPRSAGASRKSMLAPMLRSSDAPIREYLNKPMGGFPSAAWLKFAGLLHDIGKPATAQVIKGRLRFFGHEDVGARQTQRILRDLRCSRQEIQQVSAWVQNHMRLGNLAAAPKITEKAIARFFRDLGNGGVGMVLVSLGDHYSYLPRNRWGKGTDPVEKVARQLLDSYYFRREAVLPVRIVNGHVLMKKLRLKPGPLIGKLLASVQDAQVEGKVTTRDEAIAFARRKLKQRA